MLCRLILHLLSIVIHFFVLDINECNNNNGGCDHTCINKNGFHICSCNESFVLANDGRTCAGEL